MNRIFAATILMSMVLLSACGGSQVEAVVSADEATASSQHDLSITATAEGWQAAETAEAGWTRITLTNESEGLRQAAFLKLAEGKTMEDVFAAIEAGMEGPAEWMIPVGGVSAVLPGKSGTVSVKLDPGQYIVIDPVPGPDGVPGMAKGYFMPLAVEASEADTSAPEADLSIHLADYAFEADYDGFKGGAHTIKVTNSGPQEAHEIVLVKLDEGIKVDEFLQAFSPDSPGGPLPGRFVVGTGAFVEGSDNYLEVELESGASYGVICFTPSRQHQGQPHFTLGMVGQFTAQ